LFPSTISPLNLNVIVLLIKTIYSRIGLFLLIQILLCSQLYAQHTNPKIINVDPKTLNASGGSYVNNNMVINWSFGEVFSTTLTESNKIIVSTGFLQSKDMDIILVPPTDTILPIDSTHLAINVFPNPVKSYLNLTIAQSDIKLISIALYSIQGNLIQTIDEALNDAKLYNRSILMTPYPSGTYILAVRYIVDDFHYRTKLFKIIKI